MDIAIDYTQQVNCIRFVDATVMPTRLTIRADVLPMDGIEDIDIDISFAKIKFWFETIVSRSIVFSRGNGLALDMLLNEEGKPRLTNHMMISPYEPNDDHLAALFQSKMTALSKGRIAFGCVRIETDAPSGLVFTYVGDWENDLPAMTDWFEEPYFFADPWWARDDASTLDLMPSGDDIDFAKRPPWAFALDFIEDAIRPPTDKPPQETTNVEDVVIRGAFRPKIINGGKDET